MKSQMKLCVIEIGHCEDCPHFDKIDWKCTFVDRALDEGDDLPTWCPLEDVVVKE